MPDSFAQTAIGPGHNRPPVDILEAIGADLPALTQSVRERAAELLAAETRMPATLDAATAGKAADFVKQIGAAIKDGEGLRATVKAPYLDAGKMIDAAFKNIGDPLAALKRRVEAKIGDHQRRIEAEERARREAEAAKARAEMEARMAAAKTEADLQRAVEAEAEAEKAARAAQARAAEMSRARGDFGSVATVRTTYSFEIENAAAVPREYLSPDEAKIKAAIKAAGDRAMALAIPGVRVVEHRQTVVR